ncbi:MAG TPA: AmmeMemoRadiSam system radical SAM enzyme [Phycisphaerae bacterium]|nr:AmmeMemoRadiSam system radical SAM enzyme [Phycisphaerae bacterium]HRR84381.1 AmmeMemoRadiSam system radical SAM enzyme [Phycisphaerae bacterium]
MDNLDNMFRRPNRRDLLKWGTVCGAVCTCGLRPCVAQDVAGTSELEGPKLKGVIRHPAKHWEKLEDKKVRCVLCPRECEVADVERGYCGVRENQGGRYQTLVYGALCSANLDPIEKKPLFHYLPGTTAFSVATAGCNIECKFCQNWQISQFRPEQVESVAVPPNKLVAACKARSSPTIAYTYSEPVVFYEYVYDSAEQARKAGIGSVIISNGFIQEKPLRELCGQLTGVKIDLKAFTEEFYREHCAGRLAPVLKALEVLKDTGIWFELVILIIPTLNDSPDEIKEMSRWVVRQLGPDVPMHFTRFHPTYRVTNLPQTPVSTLERCRQIALDAGVHYVYAGNVPMHKGENTYCHKCQAELIRRVGFRIASNQVKDGKCPKCGTAIPGVWSQAQALAFEPRQQSRPT